MLILQNGRLSLLRSCFYLLEIIEVTYPMKKLMMQSERGNSSKDARDIWHQTTLTSFWTKAAGVRELSGIEVLAGAIVPLLRAPPTQPSGPSECQIGALH